MNSAHISVVVNDEPKIFSAPITVLRALQEIGFADRRGVAIAIDDTVVPRSQWPLRSLAQGERVLVIQATQGG